MKLLIILVVTTVTVIVRAQLEFNNNLPNLETKFQHDDQTQNRIVNGEIAKRNQFPYQVALHIDQGGSKTLACGGSIISNTCILTAAHCVDKALRLNLMLGAHNLTERSFRLIPIGKNNIVIHEKWNPHTFENDIALIKLPRTTRIEFSENVKPIPLASVDLITPTGTKAVTSGWGFTRFDAKSGSDILRYVNLAIESPEKCNTAFAGNVKSTNICTIGVNGRSPCFGDSGGPLTILVANQPVLVGCTSYGNVRCPKNVPAVFTRISSYLKWIETNSN